MDAQEAQGILRIIEERAALYSKKHPRDREALCEACGQVCMQKYDGRQIGDSEDGSMVELELLTCDGCGSTRSGEITRHPELTARDLLRVTDLRINYFNAETLSDEDKPR